MSSLGTHTHTQHRYREERSPVGWNMCSLRELPTLFHMLPWKYVWEYGFADYRCMLDLKWRQNLQAGWAICIRSSRTSLFSHFFSLPSHLSYSLGLCLKAVDQREKKYLYPGENLWRMSVWLKPLAVFTVCMSLNENSWKCQTILEAFRHGDVS